MSIVLVVGGCLAQQGAPGSKVAPSSGSAKVAAVKSKGTTAAKTLPEVRLASVKSAVRATKPIALTIEFSDGVPAGTAMLVVERADSSAGEWEQAASVPVELAEGATEARATVKLKERGRYLLRVRVERDGCEPATSNERATHVVGDKVVALTFDDGPSATTTPIVLKALKERDARATFFVSGRLAARHPKLLKREFKEGHEIASHTMLHVDLTGLSDEGLAEELSNGSKAISDVIGEAPYGLRPPYGAVDDRVRAAIRAAGMEPILWDVDTEDWRNQDAGRIASSIAEQARDGSIVLMHDSGGQVASTGAAVDGVISSLDEQGFDFVTISELDALGRKNTDKLIGSAGDFGPGFSNR